MLLIENGTVHTPTQVIPDGAVLVDGSHIESVGKRAQMVIPAGVLRLDAAGGNIAPGFINMHIHGVGGYDSLDGESRSLQAMSRLLTRHGVTSWVPTIGSAEFDVMENALRAVRGESGAEIQGAAILGAHVEGRYISPHERGAHRPDLLAEPRPAEYVHFLEYADAIRVFTLAPELPGALELIRELKERGVLVSAGHSVAIDEEFALAVEAGLSHATHLFCNMGTLRRANIRRVAGLVESVLLEDRVTSEIITDGYHIAPSLMKLGLKAKGADRLAIITDGSALTGLPPGSYSVYGRDVILEQSISYVSDRSAYAGSVATMDRCVRCAIESMGLSLRDAVRMASLTPASILGVANHKGSLEKGKDADIVVLNDTLHVTHTVVGGHVFEDRGEAQVERRGKLGWRVVV